MRKKLIFMAPLAIGGFLLFIAIGGFVVHQLWNWLLPSLFGWPSLTFWQALGLLALCRILFGRFGGRGFGPPAFARRHMAARWERMSPEERERFRQGMSGRCGFGPPTGESKATAVPE
jgi:hypothetical protein